MPPNWPKPKNPPPGYAEALSSYVLEPLKGGLIQRFESSGYFDHAVMFNSPRDVSMDEYYPHLQFHTPSSTVEKWTLNNKKMTITVEIFYYAKHLQEQGYSSAEISHFIEYATYLVENDHSLYLMIGGIEVCIFLKGVTDWSTDFFVDGSYIISMGIVSLEAVVPVCVIPPESNAN